AGTVARHAQHPVAAISDRRRRHGAHASDVVHDLQETGGGLCWFATQRDLAHGAVPGSVPLIERAGAEFAHFARGPSGEILRAVLKRQAHNFERRGESAPPMSDGAMRMVNFLSIRAS